MILILLLSFIWAFLEGKREAQYFHYKWTQPNPLEIPDEHFDFTIQRFTYVLVSSLFVWLSMGFFYGLMMFISIALCFSFIHNGSYYKRRNYMNPEIYKEKWWSQSDTTTAKFSLNYRNRLILFILGASISFFGDIIYLSNNLFISFFLLILS